MKEEIGRLFKHAGIYGVGAVLSKAVGFLMLPVYTRLLLPKDYGVLELLDLVVFFAGVFAALGIQTAVFRFYVSYDSDRDKKEIIATAFLSNAALSFLITVALLVFSPFIARNLLGDQAFAPLVQIASATLFLSNLTEVPLAYCRAQGRTTLYVCIGLARTILSLTLIVLFLVVLKLGVKGVLLGNLLANGVAGLGLFGLVAAQMPLRLDWPKLRQMLRYSIPIVPSYLVSFLLVFSDRFFLRHFANLSEVGVYSLGYKFAGIVSLLVSGPFSMTWSWQQFELDKKQEGPALYAKLQVYQLLVSVFVGLTICVFSKNVLQFMTPSSYWGAARVIPLIVLSYILSDIRLFVLSRILVKDATHYLPLVGLGTAVTNLTLNYFLISRYWAMGAAIATFLSYAVHLALTYILAQRIQAVPYDYTRNALTLGAAAGIYLASTIHSFSLVTSIAVNFLALLLFLGISVKLLDPGERRMFRQLAVGIAQRFRLISMQAQ